MDLTNLTNISSIQGLAFYTNNSVDGVLFSGGIFVFFIILLVSLLRFDISFPAALAVSGWSIFIVSLFFWFAHLLPTLVVLAFLLISGFSVLFLYANR